VTDRCVVLLLAASADVVPPAGVGVGEWRAALAEDVADVVAGLADVAGAVAATAVDAEFAAAIVWPDTPIFDAGSVLEALRGATEAGFGEAVILAADVPDLPPMHIGKLFRALGSHPVAVAPAAGGGLVALAARLPVPEWLVGAAPSLETSRMDALRAAAPAKLAVAGTPGWHRLRTPGDVDQLDPGLEGWEATRSLLDY
jgi:molybdopterin-guanine dinucleotide biosynthesis protein A